MEPSVEEVCVKDRFPERVIRQGKKQKERRWTYMLKATSARLSHDVAVMEIELCFCLDCYILK